MSSKVLFSFLFISLLQISSCQLDNSLEQLSSCEMLKEFQKSVRFEETRDLLLVTKENFDILYAETGGCPSEGYSSFLSSLSGSIGDLHIMGAKVDTVVKRLKNISQSSQTTMVCSQNIKSYITQLVMWRNFMYSFGVAVTSPPCERSLDDVPLFKEALGEVEPFANLSMCEGFTGCKLSD